MKLEILKKHRKSNIKTTLDFIKEIIQAANEVPKALSKEFKE